MKITKKQLRRIIAEELNNISEIEEDPTKLKQQAVSTSQRKKDALARIKDTDTEFSSQEKGLVNQLEGYVSRLASLPGVDLVQHRSLLQRMLKMLEAAIGKKHREQPQGEQQ
tara:strand:+ start:940 stop:1275 length:336 start_codon:yes stop_codon:yes gene_type:complete